uniref:Spermatogenesis-defective protein 39 homolog n=1 Tax=Astyanax mexicanus TaxID=7994 RepID=A0A8B9HP50_ASTMX
KRVSVVLFCQTGVYYGSKLELRAKPEDDEYWNSSKFSAFTFDDEDDEFTKMKESKRAVNSILVDDDDDDDDVEKVSWSGEPIGSISWSVKETASSFRSSGEQSFPKIDTAPSLPKQGSGYSLSSLFKAFTDTSTRAYAPELRKPKSECKDYMSDWSPEETVRRMRKGRAYSLERFRSLQDKLLLLDEAVSLHDGNVITAVLIYLKRSLSKEILFRELMVREVALRHYVHYLKEMGEQKLLLMQYKEHLNIKDEGRRRDFLKSCLSLPFSQDDAMHVQDHYTLLERQIIIEANDKRGEAEIFRKYPRKASILNMPLITTLYYSCFYHYGEPEGTFSSPANIRKTFRISEKQYILTALGARAKLKSWFDVDSLFNTKNWLGYTKKRSPIGFHRVVDILQKNNAPAQVLQEYVNLIDDPELRLSLAQKYKCHDIVIDTYKDLKDRQQLIVYQGKVERGSHEDRKIEELINNMQIRWKN